jgi:hypothetical protein
MRKLLFLFLLIPYVSFAQEIPISLSGGGGVRFINELRHNTYYIDRNFIRPTDSLIVNPRIYSFNDSPILNFFFWDVYFKWKNSKKPIEYLKKTIVEEQNFVFKDAFGNTNEYLIVDVLISKKANQEVMTKLASDSYYDDFFYSSRYDLVYVDFIDCEIAVLAIEKKSFDFLNEDWIEEKNKIKDFNLSDWKKNHFYSEKLRFVTNVLPANKRGD